MKGTGPLRSAAVVALLGLSLGRNANAQQSQPPREPSELDFFALEEELKAVTKVASSKAISMRESPAIVSLITEEQIAASGARDLMDVLQLVPGFHFGTDVLGVVGLSVRGNWAHEAKHLLLIDGLQMGEGLFGTTQLDQHYPIENVKQIEIIRGPGSAKYGGSAELTVINVVTRKGGQDLKGVRVSGYYGQAINALGRAGTSVQAGYASEDNAYGGQIFARFGRGTQGQGPYRDVAGNGYEMADGNTRTPLWISGGAQLNGFNLRFILDNYATNQRDGFGDVSPVNRTTSFRGVYALANYEWKLGDRFTLSPEVTWRSQDPWNTVDVQPGSSVADDFMLNDSTYQRLTGRLTLSADLIDGLNLVVGGESYVDRAMRNRAILGEDQLPFENGEQQISYASYAAFAEALWQNPIVNVVAGARFESHSKVGASFVPRIALTKQLGPVHFKALYSRAFKTPVIENLAKSPELAPELADVAELEAGYQVSENLYASANLFDITINRPIIYFYDPALDSDGYKNADRTGTRGVELELRSKFTWGSAWLSYSFFTAASKNLVADYQVPGQDGLTLGNPAHKVALNSSFNVWRNLSVSPSAIFVSQRYGITSLDADGNYVYEAEPAALWLNVNVAWKDLFTRGLEVGVRGYNLLGMRQVWIQPYSGGHAALVGQGREIGVYLGYEYGL